MGFALKLLGLQLFCLCTLWKDMLALYKFEDGSVAVEEVSLIKEYDPEQHCPSVWPPYHGPSQKNNWVKVKWPEADQRTGKASGKYQLYAAQIGEFGDNRDMLLQRGDEMLSPPDDPAAASQGPSQTML